MEGKRKGKVDSETMKYGQNTERVGRTVTQAERELIALLCEARQVLDDWSDEYGHKELEDMAIKIDEFLLMRAEKTEKPDR